MYLAQCIHNTQHFSKTWLLLFFLIPFWDQQIMGKTKQSCELLEIVRYILQLTASFSELWLSKKSPQFK